MSSPTTAPEPAAPADFRVGGLVLAAGSGERLGGPKALVEVDGERWVDRSARVLREGGAAVVAVVLGAALTDVALAGVVVVNAHWAEGMGSSVRAGLASPALDGCSAVVVLVVDQPGVGPEAVRRLIAAHATGAELGVATYGGRRGHPVLLGRSHWAGVSAGAVGDIGARAYLGAHPDLVREVPCDDLGDGADIDTPDQLAARFPDARFARAATPLPGAAAE